MTFSYCPEILWYGSWRSWTLKHLSSSGNVDVLKILKKCFQHNRVTTCFFILFSRLNQLLCVTNPDLSTMENIDPCCHVVELLHHSVTFLPLGHLLPAQRNYLTIPKWIERKPEISAMQMITVIVKSLGIPVLWWGDMRQRFCNQSQPMEPMEEQECATWAQWASQTRQGSAPFQWQTQSINHVQ